MLVFIKCNNYIPKKILLIRSRCTTIVKRSFNVLVRFSAQMKYKIYTIYIYKCNNRYSATYRVHDNYVSYNQVQS